MANKTCLEKTGESYSPLLLWSTSNISDFQSNLNMMECKVPDMFSTQPSSERFRLARLRRYGAYFQNIPILLFRGASTGLLYSSDQDDCKNPSTFCRKLKLRSSKKQIIAFIVRFSNESVYSCFIRPVKQLKKL